MSSITTVVLTKRYALPSEEAASEGISSKSSSSLVQSENSAFRRYRVVKAQEAPMSLAELSAEYVSGYIKDLHVFLMWKVFGFEPRSRISLPLSLSCAPVPFECFSSDCFKEFESWRTPSSALAPPSMTHRIIFDVVKESIEEINDTESLVYVSGQTRGPLSLHVGKRSERLCISFRNFLSKMDKIVLDKIFPKELEQYLKKEHIAPMKRKESRSDKRKHLDDYLFDISAKSVIAHSKKEDIEKDKFIESILSNEEAMSFLAAHLEAISECRRDIASASTDEERSLFERKSLELSNHLYQNFLSITQGITSDDIDCLLEDLKI